MSTLPSATFSPTEERKKKIPQGNCFTTIVKYNPTYLHSWPEHSMSFLDQRPYSTWYKIVVNILHNRFTGLWWQDLSQNVAINKSQRNISLQLSFYHLIVSFLICRPWSHLLPRILREIAPVPPHNVQTFHLLDFIQCSWKLNLAMSCRLSGNFMWYWYRHNSLAHSFETLYILRDFWWHYSLRNSLRDHTDLWDDLFQISLGWII